MALSAADIGERLKAAIGIIEEISEEMDDTAVVCSQCAINHRRNMDDYKAKQALEAAADRLSKLYDMIYEGKWQGRELAPVVTAESVRAEP